jgi:hypothetical protein
MRGLIPSNVILSEGRKPEVEESAFCDAKKQPETFWFQAAFPLVGGGALDAPPEFYTQNPAFLHGGSKKAPYIF